MKTIPSVGSVMTASPVAVEIDASIRDAEDLMTDHEIRHLPVVDKGRVVAALSDRDIAFASNGPGGDVVEGLSVRDVCTFDVYSVAPEEPLDVVLEEMAKRRIGSAIVAKDEHVEGLFTVTDACRCFAEYLRDA